MVDRNLEGDMRVAFEKNKIPLADTVWVLHTGRNPASDQKFGLGLIAFSVVHDNGDELVHGHWGLEELVLGGRRDLFFDVNLRVVERMIRTGRRRLVLGKAMPDLKAMFGARLEPQFAVFGLR